MTNQIDDQWDDVLDAASEVVSAYTCLLEASDGLAEKMGYNRDYVLGKIIPKVKADRRCSDRVLRWLNAEKEMWVISTKAANEARREALEKAALLKRLNLSDDEKKILGL